MRPGSPSPASAACHPDLMFQFEGKRAYFFLSVNFKEINIASGVTSYSRGKL